MPAGLRGLTLLVLRVAFRFAALLLLALFTPGALARQREDARRLVTDIRRGRMGLARLRGEGGRLQRTRSDEAEQHEKTEEHDSTPSHGITFAREQK